MRILITTGIFKPEPGGPATYAAELARRLHAAGHPVKVITYSDQPHYPFDREFKFPLLRIVRTKNKLVNYLKCFFVIYREAKNYDLIYSLDWFSVGVPLMIAAFLRGKKYYVRVGGGYIWEKYLAEHNPPMSLKAFYEKGLYKRYKTMYFFIKRVLRRAEHVIFNSDEQKYLYQKYYFLKPEKTSTIYNPIPETRFSNLVQTYKKSYEFRDKEIVFAGRFIKMKNVESAIQAFARLKDSSFNLLLIGNGPTEHELRDLVTALGISNRVQFLPTMNQADLYRRISNCYYVILPSWTDISPNQIYECLSLGIPFLLTKENYLSIDKKELMMIDPASIDDIAEKMNILLDPAAYNAFAEKLSGLSFKHSWQEVLVEHMKLLIKRP